MMTIKEQKEMVESNIAANETLIASLKDDIKADKARLKKLDKIEKELTSIFGEPEDNAKNNVITLQMEEIPGQVGLDNVIENVG